MIPNEHVLGAVVIITIINSFILYKRSGNYKELWNKIADTNKESENRFTRFDEDRNNRIYYLYEYLDVELVESHTFKVKKKKKEDN
jgi:hypothetical protein